MTNFDSPFPGRFANSRTSSTLLNKLRGSQIDDRQEARWRFYVLYGPLIFGRCKRAGLTSDDSLDVTHDVIVKVLEGINRFRKEEPGDSFRSWLTTITLNAIRDRRRKADLVLLGDNAEQLIEPTLGADQAERAALARRLYNLCLTTMGTEFEPTTLEAFELVCLQGRSVGDAAKLLGLSENAVRIAKFRVLRRLRQLGKEFFDEQP